jgi:hypothetical protein
MAEDQMVEQKMLRKVSPAGKGLGASKESRRLM